MILIITRIDSNPAEQNRKMILTYTRTKILAPIY